MSAPTFDYTYPSKREDAGWSDAQTPLLPGAHPAVAEDRRKIRIRRICHFFFAFTLFVLVIHVLSDTVRIQTSRALGFDFEAMADPEWSIPEGVSIVDCPAWEFGEHSDVGTVSFNFALPAAELFALARGPRSHGTIQIRQSDGETDDVRVNVEMHSDAHGGFDHAKVCLSKRKDEDDSVGVGIFTDHWWDNHHHRGHNHHIHFVLELVLPKHNEVLHITKLTTDMPIFTHNVDELADAVSFDSFNLHTTNAAIHTGSVHTVHGVVRTSNAAIDGVYVADENIALRTSNGRIAASASAIRADIRTSNGHIEGEYSASRVLVLLTHNGPINAAVALVNDPDGPPTEVDMTTSNSKIRVNLNLTSTKGSSGSFVVGARSSNAGLALEFTDAPLDAALQLNAHTSMGSADVRLHQTYEGSFTASTSHSRVQVQMGDGEDQDRGRKSISVTRHTGSYVEGVVGWSDLGASRGTAHVSTKMGPVSLWI